MRFRVIVAACALGATLGGGVCAADAERVVLDQNWSPELRALFHHTPQGSRMMPLAWFSALERADGAGLFASPGNLGRFGFLRPLAADAALNPTNLPVGFAIDPVDQPRTGRWVGFTCAACHTGEATYRGVAMRIEGGPAQIDLDMFTAELATAIGATLTDEAQRRRFIARVLNSPNPPEAEARALGQAFQVFATGFLGRAALRHPAVPGGPGRVDALTQIINSLAVTDLGIPENMRPVAAPVSYPPLWTTPRQEFVQWAPIAASPIGRNAGEVLGVYGHAGLRGAPDTMLGSTALIRELGLLETWVEALEAPRWPEEIFGPIDDALAAEGKAIFDGACRACHAMPPFEMTDPAQNAFGKSFIRIGRIPQKALGVDGAYTRALAARTVLTGDLAALVFDGRPVVSAAEFFLRTVGAVVEHDLRDARLGGAEMVALNGFRFRPGEGGAPPQPYAPGPADFVSLKAGPLLGLWATAPYLHNGSAPTVYDLLSPPESRPRVFWTGGREIDPVRLGLDTRRAPGRFRFDTRIEGNGAGGHAYPPGGLSHAQRLAVIEYLKDPMRFADAPAR
jgi:mono/diheme cytochrome c family protein